MSKLTVDPLMLAVFSLPQREMSFCSICAVLEEEKKKHVSENEYNKVDSEASTYVKIVGW